MASVTADPVVQRTELHNRLAWLRLRLRGTALTRGIALLAAVLLLTALTAGALDYRFRLPGVVRALFLTAGLAGAGVVVYRWLYKPLRAPVDDLALALRIEDHYPGLNDSLASTVQFLEGDAGSGSPVLRREAVRRGLKGLDACELGRVIDRRGLLPALLLGLLALGSAAMVGIARPELSRVGLARLLDPFGGHEWPRETRLEIDLPRTRIGRNEFFPISGRAFGVVPPTATVVFKLDGVNSTERTCEVTADEDGRSGAFSTRLDATRVQRDFQFQVRAHDAVTPWYPVTVLPPPLLVPLNGKASPQVRLTSPAYTELPEQDLPEGNGNVEAVAGTVVLLRAAANRPLAAAWVEYQPEPRYAEVALFLGPLGVGHPVGALALTAMGQTVWQRVPAELAADATELSVSFRPPLGGMYALHIEDETGLHNARLFELRIHQDPAPVVTLERPSATRDNLLALPDAILPLQLVAEDPQFGLRTVFLEYRCRKTDPPRRVPLYDSRTAPPLAPGGPGALVGAEGVAAAVRGRPQRLPISRPLRLQDFRHLDPAKGGLKEGDVLSLQACADDFDDVTVNKQPGRSHEIEIRIVGRNALELAVNKAQAEVQQQLVVLRKLQQDALKKVEEAQKQLKQAGKLSPQDADQLLQAEQIQQQIRERVGNTKQEGLRADVGRILETLKNNPLPRTAAQERMNAVARELERLAEEELGQIEPRLSNARKSGPGEESPTGKPEAGKPEAGKPEAGKPEAGKPETRKPEASKPEAGKPEADKPQRAQQVRREAGEAEQKAQASEAEATGLEKQVRGLPDNDPGRAKAQGRADQARQQAEDLKKKAQELARQAAEAEKAEKAQPSPGVAGGKPEGDKPQDGKPQEKPGRNDETRQLLKEARQHQEEVEKTLNDLLGRLEPWTSTQEVKGEAKSLLEEQKRLQQQTEELQQKELKGEGKPDEAAERKGELERIKSEQQKLRERTQGLLDRMERVAQERKGSDPRTAEEMENAARLGRESNVGGLMQEAREKLGQNQLGQASEKQRESARQLENLVKTLEDRREAELDRLVKKLREQEKELARLEEEMERLKKKTEEAARIGDARERDEELKRLAREQENLREKAEEALKQLSRHQAERSRQALGRAAEQMQEASQQMQGGQTPEEAQEEALDRLAEAREDLQRAREEAEEELAREQLARVADEIKRLRERQEALAAEGARLQKELLERKPDDWRAPLISLGRLAEAQGLKDMGLAAEVTALAERKLDGAPVVAQVVRRTAEVMDQASVRLLEHRDEANAEGRAETRAGAEAARLQKDALRRLDHVLEAITEAAQRPGARQGGGGNGEQGGGEGAGGGGAGDGIPPLAQLKLLRQLQAEVNRRTEEFRKGHPDPNNLDEAARAGLQDIRREQREVTELLEELLAGGEPEGGKP